MRLVAIVPATDSPRTLSRCTAAIFAAREPPESVVVVDDPSIGGPAQARNIGAERASADVLVFVDSDVEVHPDAFVRIREAFTADEALVAVFGSYDDDPERHGLISDFRNLLHHHVHTTSAGPATTFWAGLGAIRRDAFTSIGGFNEELFPNSSIEDIELGMRVRRECGRIRLDPAIRGKHLKRWTLRTMVATDLLRRGIPWVQLLLSADRGSTALNLGWRHRASAIASAGVALSLATRRPRVAAALGVGMVYINGDFYAVLLRQRGWRQAAVGVPLHMLHHLAGIAAVPAGVYLYIRDSRRSTRDQDEPKS
jgi:Glycosyl transferase family 21